jgi:hypothetical protein
MAVDLYLIHRVIHRVIVVVMVEVVVMVDLVVMVEVVEVVVNRMDYIVFLSH